MEASETPLRAGWATRIVYALALVGFLPASLVAGSGWIGLVLGGGTIGALGVTVTLVIGALAVFRAYQALRYPGALDARPPNILGWLLRFLGWLGMLVGAASAIGLFFVKPITLLLFKSAGDAGIGYFAVGLWLVMLTGWGWPGCLLFEISRVCGHAFAPHPPWSRRRQDFAVLGVLVAAAIGAPFLLRATVGEPCGEKNLAACISTTEGGVRRVIALGAGEPVALASALEEIEMRSSSGRKWSLLESPAESLKMAGHPAVASGAAKVLVRIEAASAAEGATVTLVVMEGAEETARFVTRFRKGARLERRAGGMRLVADLPGNAEPGMRSASSGPSGKTYSIDQLFIQFRSAIGTEQEAREWPLRVERAAALVSSGAGGAGNFDDEPLPAQCKGRVQSVNAEGAPSFQGNLGWPMRAVTFLDSSEPGPHALMGGVDRVVCRDDEIWIVSYYDRRPQLRIRRYSRDGKLQRFIDTAIPPAKLSEGEIDVVMAANVRAESDGRVRFVRSIITDHGLREKTRDLFELAP